MSKILSNEEKEFINECLDNIKDKLRAIKMEMERDIQSRYYLKEKIDSIVWDSQVIQNICSKEEK